MATKNAEGDDNKEGESVKTTEGLTEAEVQNKIGRPLQADARNTQILNGEEWSRIECVCKSSKKTQK